MKKFFMCCVVVVCALFVGFTAYYFVANKENITLASDTSSSIKLNVGDTLNLSDLIKHTRPNAGTVIDATFSVEGVLSYNKSTKQFKAEKVGNLVVTITPSNSRFGPFVFNATVGDGSMRSLPYYIRTTDELAQIGKPDSHLTSAMHYELLADLYLTDRNWQPISTGAQFTGSFNGAGHAIYDMNIKQDYSRAGLFATVGYGAIVQDITLIGAQIQTNAEFAGVVAGENFGTISLCQVLEAVVVNSGSATGGIVGQNNFMESSNGGTSGRIGMCGIASSTITASNFVGGIAGSNHAGIIENCFAVLNEVNGASDTKFGGIVGKNTGFTSSTYDKISIIYKSYAYVKSVKNTSLTSGAVAENVNPTATIPNNFINNLFVVDTQYYVGTSTEAPTNQILKTTADNLKKQETYQTWDFSNVWLMADNYAVVNFKGTYITNISDVIIYPDVDPIDPPGPGPGPGPYDPDDPPGPYVPPGPIDPIYPDSSVITQNNVWTILKQMHDYPNSGRSYTISSNITVNLSTASAQYQNLFPFGTKEKPFTCSVTPISNQKLTFANLTLQNVDYASLFGYVGTGAAISGVYFINANVAGSEATNAGILASDIMSGALVANCSVSDSTLSGRNNIGLIAGYNAGSTLNNVAASSTVISTNQANAGALFGLNDANVSNSSSKSVTVIANASGNYGAVVGFNNGVVAGCLAQNAYVNGQASDNVYVGGIVGQNAKSISNCLVSNSKCETSMTKSYCYVGGLAGINSSAITNSHVDNSIIIGYYAGGLVALNKGSVSQCTAGEYNQGRVTGVFAGGLASINAMNATFKNCLVGTQMVTASGSQKTCGFAYKLEKDSVISNCFSYAIFSGSNGEKFAETDSPFRDFWGNIWSDLGFMDKMGVIDKSLVYNVSGVILHGNGVLPDFLNPEINNVQVNEQEAKGSNNWEKFYVNGFDFAIWKRVSGQYLSLR